MTKSFPVRYMVVQCEDFLSLYDIEDTSNEYPLYVAEYMELIVAQKICKFLNESEGYRYDIE